MDQGMDKQLDLLSRKLDRLWSGPSGQIRMSGILQALDRRYSLKSKLENEPQVGDILEQMVGRLAHSYGKLADLEGKALLDIACGSNTSRLPASLFLKTLFGGTAIRGENKGYTALFEPWFCRILFELGAAPVGLDFGNLEGELFTHYHVDLGQPGALDFLPDHSFDGLQDSRLFGSPEFTAEFPNESDRLKVADEIVLQERRLLKVGGIIIHSDAQALVSGKW